MFTILKFENFTNILKSRIRDGARLTKALSSLPRNLAARQSCFPWFAFRLQLLRVVSAEIYEDDDWSDAYSRFCARDLYVQLFQVAVSEQDAETRLEQPLPVLAAAPWGDAIFDDVEDYGRSDGSVAIESKPTQIPNTELFTHSALSFVQPCYERRLAKRLRGRFLSQNESELYVLVCG